MVAQGNKIFDLELSDVIAAQAQVMWIFAVFADSDNKKKHQSVCYLQYGYTKQDVATGLNRTIDQ